MKNFAATALLWASEALHDISCTLEEYGYRWRTRKQSSFGDLSAQQLAHLTNGMLERARPMMALSSFGTPVPWPNEREGTIVFRRSYNSPEGEKHASHQG